MKKTNRQYERMQKAWDESSVIDTEFRTHIDEIIDDVTAKISGYVASSRIKLANLKGYVPTANENDRTMELLQQIIRQPSIYINPVLFKVVFSDRSMEAFMYQSLLDCSDETRQLKARYGGKLMKTIGCERIEKTAAAIHIYKRILRRFSSDEMAALLSQNPRYQAIAPAAAERVRILDMLSSAFISSVPDNYAMLYPEARSIKRHFVIHLGPTNSGKTHDAIESLAQAPTGVYLAPLRLLAYEQYERLTQMGVKCSMVTGEERITVPDSTHRSCTIEMLDIMAHYDVAVIDEAQMAADIDRGGAWTSAILGARADIIHLCASPDIKDCLIKMISACGDTYEIREHDRMTPLVVEKQPFNYPNDIQDGDALIVFSRRDVQACAADLSRKGIDCSVIYGNLPYDVRHAEASKFASGQTKVVVSTDAIGLGMNLPIRRVVFLRVEKFDGHNLRYLHKDEIKQIAGRAGRYGLYEQGYVNAFAGLKRIRAAIASANSPIHKAVIDIPPIFFEKEGKISDILEVWDSLPATQDYEKSNIDIKIQLAKELEGISDDKGLILEFISIPFDERSLEVHRLWLDLFTCLYEGMPADIGSLIGTYDPTSIGSNERDTEKLESMYKIYDLLFYYASKHGDDSHLAAIMERKRMISDKLNAIFGQGKFQNKLCRQCGRKMSWLSRYGICDRCYQHKFA